jgi:mono/diheme cytochrome c family protein
MDVMSFEQFSRSRWGGLFSAVCFILLLCTDVGHSLAQEEAQARKALTKIIARDAVVARGEESFMRNCASCHGTQAIGDGPVAATLKVEPANLTQLSKKEGGEFPFWGVHRSVDGRLELPGHGTREMPIWGFVFRKSHLDTEAQVRDRILDLVYYIESVQEE